MLFVEQIRIDVGRAEGGDYMRVVHTPTGIERAYGPPLGNKFSQLKKKFLQEIEDELLEKGLTEYTWQDKTKCPTCKNVPLAKLEEYQALGKIKTYMFCPKCQNKTDIKIIDGHIST